MGAKTRNAFIVSKALKTFVLAAVLTAAASQLAHTADSMIVGHTVGADAVSAINLVLPLVEVLNCMGFLICFGANAMCAQAIGSGNKEKTAKTFTSVIISVLTLGLFVSLLMSLFSPAIVDYISDEPRLDDMAVDYIRTYSMGGWLQMLSYGLCLMVATDGRPRVVTKAVVGGALLNVIVDVLLIIIFDMGVKGAALGSLSMFVANILILTYYLRKPQSSYRLMWPGKSFFSIFINNIKEGAPVTVSNSMMAVTILLINHIVEIYLGADGLFLWSVCLQMLLLSYVFIDGVIESLFAIGGVLVGERDLKGVQILVVQALIIIAILVSLVILFMWVPGLVGKLFGVADPVLLTELDRVLRIFALMLVPFAVTQILLSTYQLVGHEKASLVTAISQTVMMVAVVWLVAEAEGVELWWGFAAACVMVLLFQLSYTFTRSKIQSGTHISPITMIPDEVKGYTFDRSVHFGNGDVYVALDELDKFLKAVGVPKDTLFELNLCCEELMSNIDQYSESHASGRSFDLHVNISKDSIFITIKDDGRPFDPIQAGKMADERIGQADHEHLGLRLVTNIIPDITYKYMYGQNTVFISRKMKQDVQ